MRTQRSCGNSQDILTTGELVKYPLRNHYFWDRSLQVLFGGSPGASGVTPEGRFRALVPWGLRCSSCSRANRYPGGCFRALGYKAKAAKLRNPRQLACFGGSQHRCFVVPLAMWGHFSSFCSMWGQFSSFCPRDGVDSRANR